MITVNGTTDHMNHAFEQNPGSRGPLGLFRRIGACRLCWKVTAAVFVAILAIEAVLLGFSTFFYQNARLDEVEMRGQVAWQALVDSRGPKADAAQLLAASEAMASGEAAAIVGGVIYGMDGKKIGAFGETPTLGAASADHLPYGPYREHYGADRFETIWRAVPGRTEFTLFARMDSSAVAAEVKGFVSRVIGQVVLIAVFVTVATMLILHRLLFASLLNLRQNLAAAGRDLQNPEQHKAPVRRRDELGDLMQAFNDMLAQLGANLRKIRQSENDLAEANRQLEGKVAARTRELEREVQERKQAEKEVAILARFPEENPSPVLRVAADGQVLYANPPGRDMLTHWGVPRDGKLVEPWNSLVAEAAHCQISKEVDTDGFDDRTFALIFQPVPDEGYVNVYGRDVTQRKEAEDRVRHLANHDVLTGLPNRALFKDRLEQALRMAHRSGRQVAVHMLDLDHFKDVNDTLGHAAGDQLLVQVADRLKTCIRESDSVARLGGDEFAIIQLDSAGETGATVMAQKVLDALAKPMDIDDQTVHAGGSIGITTFPDDAGDAEQLLRNADMALYQAKGEGRGVYRFFVSALNEAMLQRRRVEGQLREALERGEFVMHYQPKLNLKKGSIAGMEALIRWIHPEHGFQSPGEFIPIAERSKLIVPIGRWAMEEACRQNKAWQDAGLAPCKVAVNLSAVQLQQPGIVQEVKDVLAKTGLEPRYLELEITESVAMDDAEKTIRLFGELADIGVSLSIDDFGTGYSSLAYLKNFPVQRIKIDKAFVDDIEHAGSAAPIARAVTTLGQSFGMEVTAEGVEEAEQLAYLENLGCDEIQGYFISKPLAAADFEAFMREGEAMPSAAVH